MKSQRETLRQALPTSSPRLSSPILGGRNGPHLAEEETKVTGSEVK